MTQTMGKPGRGRRGILAAVLFAALAGGGALGVGRHTVRVEATDGGGLRTARQWGFYVK